MTALVEAPEQTIKKIVAAKGPIGTVIDKLESLREDKRQLETRVKAIEEEFKELEEQLMARLDAEGMDKATGKKASVSISKSVSGNIADWESFTKFVKKTGHFHLLQRRLSDPAIRELLESKGSVPGIETYTKRRLNLRSL